MPNRCVKSNTYHGLAACESAGGEGGLSYSTFSKNALFDAIGTIGIRAASFLFIPSHLLDVCCGLRAVVGPGIRIGKVFSEDYRGAVFGETAITPAVVKQLRE
jgi:hypothetical protein